ncbi:hypothetical protein GALMADRAFT_142629 [Galerina marginata CBS 339.88]|uniref:Hydrophobin n=1 Tax=Galerina marginata (strain CBS 339.88) TaxID=685588 RepID=A0A067SPQ9_GALM3|nr:hypothetical protein GALMADRAFT_142629 [Galerina marginata CBS 339.88]
MFSKIALFAAASMAVFVAAAPAPGGSEGGVYNSCNTGPVQCCNSLVESDSQEGTWLTALVGIAVGTVTGQVGANCTPITLIGTGKGASCTSSPVCCSNNSFNGLVAIGCSPVNINA